jgi:hypothetical protein
VVAHWNDTHESAYIRGVTPSRPAESSRGLVPAFWCAVAAAALCNTLWVASSVIQGGWESASGFTLQVRLVHLTEVSSLVFFVTALLAAATGFLPFVFIYRRVSWRRWGAFAYLLASGILGAALLCFILPHNGGVFDQSNATSSERFFAALPRYAACGGLAGIIQWAVIRICTRGPSTRRSEAA